MAISRISGDRFMTLAATAFTSPGDCPGDGQGSVVATIAASELNGAPEVVIDKVILTTGAAGASTLIFKNSAGTQFGPSIQTPTNTILIAAVDGQQVIDFGPMGLRVPVISGSAAFSVQTGDAAIRGIVLYRRVRRGG